MHRASTYSHGYVLDHQQRCQYWSIRNGLSLTTPDIIFSVGLQVFDHDMQRHIDIAWRRQSFYLHRGHRLLKSCAQVLWKLLSSELNSFCVLIARTSHKLCTPSAQLFEKKCGLIFCDVALSRTLQTFWKAVHLTTLSPSVTIYSFFLKSCALSPVYFAALTHP